MSRVVLALVAVLSLFPPGAVRAANEESPRVVRYRDDKLTLRATNAPIGEILDEIKRQSGAELKGQAPKIDNVTADFEAVPLNEALQRLMGENFTLRYGDDKRLKTIELKGGPEEAKPVPKAPEFQNATEATDEPASWIRAYRSLNGRDPVPVHGAFAKLIERDSANWDMLVNTSIGYPDRKVRNQAVRDGLKAIENDPEIRAAVMDTVGTMDNVDLANFALHNCKWMCEDLLKSIVRQTSDPDFRNKGLALLRQLRTMPKPERTGEMH